VGRCKLDASGLRQGPGACCCEHGKEPLGSIKNREFDYLSDYQLLKKELAPWSE